MASKRMAGTLSARIIEHAWGYWKSRDYLDYYDRLGIRPWFQYKTDLVDVLCHWLVRLQDPRPPAERFGMVELSNFDFLLVVLGMMRDGAPASFKKSLCSDWNPSIPTYAIVVRMVAPHVKNRFTGRPREFAYRFQVEIDGARQPHIRLYVMTADALYLQNELNVKFELADPTCVEAAWDTLLCHARLNGLRPKWRRKRDVFLAAIRRVTGQN